MWRFFLTCFALPFVIWNCDSSNVSIYEEYHNKLDNIRENKYKDLIQYMDFVKRLASHITEDSVMKRLFMEKSRLYQLLRTKQPSLSESKKLAQLRDAIENRYIENYLLFYDILFIDNTGNIFYTVRRQADYHKNIFEGKLAQTALSAQLKKNPTKTFVDFHNYEISGEPSAFFVEPHMSDSKLLGWFVLQFSINKINDMFTVEEALGLTGEVFLVNNDCYMLTDSRFFAESTVLRRHLSENNIRSKFEEGVGHKTVIDYRGYRAMTSFKVVSILNSKWLLIAKIDEDEIITEKYKKNRNKTRKTLLQLTEEERKNYKYTDLNVVKQIEVDMDEFRRASNGEVLYTHGVSSCTAFIISQKRKFAYLAHISAYDWIYGGKQTDIVRRMLKRVDEFDVTRSDKREVEIAIVTAKLPYTENLIDVLVDWGVFLSQIKLVHNSEARYANLSHNYLKGETLVEWKIREATGATSKISLADVKSLGDMLKCVQYKWNHNVFTEKRLF